MSRVTPIRSKPAWRGFRMGQRVRRRFALGAALAMLPGLLPANPTGGMVAAGSATLSAAGPTFTVTQQSDRAIINWQDFSIRAGELTRFVQPGATSVVLNRVVSGNPSQLLGNLEANGRVYLINPNGILVGGGARIDAAGFLASTLETGNTEFMAGGDLRFTGGSDAAVRNSGAIHTGDGGVLLIARHVANDGNLTAAGGAVGLAAGSEVLLTTGGPERVFVQAASAPGTINQAGQITATTAELKAAGGNAYALAINQRGVVRATGTAERGGQIWLVAEGGAVESSGTLDVSSATGQGGHLAVKGDRVSLAPGSHLNAAGATGGGEIFVLGRAQVMVGGTLDAGASGGDGGFIETSAAHVQVTDSTRVTTLAPRERSGTWLIDPVDFTIAASGGDMTGAAVGTALAGGNFTIQSTSGGTGTAGDVNVNDTVSWTANRLTLNAQNNINLNAGLNGSGTAALALEYGQGAVAAGNTSSYRVNAAVTLPAGNNFSTKLGSDGAVTAFTVITSLGAAGSTSGTDLQGMTGNLSRNYALGGNVDASATAGWDSGAGFAPVGDSGAPFTGRFDGLGHTISGLTINRFNGLFALPVGLFGVTGPGSVVRNVGLVGGAVGGGGLIDAGEASVGALIGRNQGTVTQAYATTTVTGDQNNLGGLVGINDAGGTISRSSATGAVSSVNHNGYYTNVIGGLVGYNLGTIDQSHHTTGTVTAGGYVGGLVGLNDHGGLVTASSASGDVTSLGNVGLGGLVGWNSGTISRSYYASGTLILQGNFSFAGGLTGYNDGSIDHSYASGTLNGYDQVGGLIGYNDGAVATSYATVSVAGHDYVGGLIGLNSPHDLDQVFASGTVTGTGDAGLIGGLIGFASAGDLSTAYWNKDVMAAGLGTSSAVLGGTGLTAAELKQAAKFPGFNFTTEWKSYDGYTMPLLKTFLTPLTVTAVSAAPRIYNGSAFSGGNGVTYSTPPTAALLGTLTYAGTAQGAQNTGTYTIAPAGLYSHQQGYDIATVNGVLTINPAALTITAANAGKTYGQALTFAGTEFSTIGLQGGETVGSVTLTSAGAAAGANVAGSPYSITPSAAAGGTFSASNYTISYAAGALTVNPAGLTITADTTSRTYGAANPALTVNYTGLVNGDTSAVVSGLAVGTPATTGSGVGSYGITPAGATAANYTISYAPGTLTVNPAGLTITANDANRTYGAANPAFTASYGGLVNSDTSAVVSGLTLTTTATTSANVGSYVITPSGATAANYAIGYVSGTLTINPASLTIAANNANRIYGAANPVFTASYSGFVNSDTSAAVSGLALATTAVTGSNVGTYGITPSGATAANYTIGYAPGALTINPAALTITAANASKTYGQALTFAGTEFSATGLQNSETVGSVTLTSAGATAGANVAGSPYGITSSAATGGTFSASNYAISYAPGALMVNPAGLTITANNASRAYGAANPAFTASYGGLVNSDTSAVVSGLTLTTTATTSVNVGSYAITPAGATAANYAISYAPGMLAVNPAALMITANNANRIYGAANPAFTAAYLGLVNGDTPAVVSGLTLGTPATAASPAGSYAITAAGASAANYAITLGSGVLTVGGGLLTITANDASRAYGAANPVFTASYSGLLSGDTPSVVTGLQFSTTATTGSNVGRYAITPFGASASGYAIGYVPGRLTINPAALTITANDASRIYGGANPAFTASYTGFVNGETSVAVSGLTLGTTAGTGSNVGTYAITPAGAAAANYTISYAPGALTINPAALTITANDASRVYGGANPSFTAIFSGLVNGDAPAVVTGLGFATPATPDSLLGRYTIAPTGGTAANYTLTRVPGWLEVTTPVLDLNGSPLSVLSQGGRPFLTDDYAVVELAGWPVLLVGPARDPARVSPDRLLPVFAAARRSEGQREGRAPVRTPRIGWIEDDPEALRKLARRAIARSSSYAALDGSEQPAMRVSFSNLLP